MASSFREDLGRVLLYGLHAPPVSWLWMPLVPVAVRIERATARRLPALSWALRVSYYGVVVAVAVVLNGEIPHVPVEDLAFAVLGLGAGVALPVRGPRWLVRGLSLALIMAALQALVPPLDFTLAFRAGLALAAFLGTLSLVLLAGRRALESAPGLALAIALVSSGLWGRHAVFFNLPEAGGQESQAGVTRVQLPADREQAFRRRGGTAYLAFDPPRFLVENCDGSELILGRLNGLFRFPAVGAVASDIIPLGGTNAPVRDCERDVLYVGHVNTHSEELHEILEVDLGPFEVKRRVGYCAARTPDSLRMDREHDRIYAYDDTGEIHSVSIDEFRCREQIPGTFIRDFTVDPTTGVLLVWDEGRVRRFDPASMRYDAELAIPSPRALPHPFGFHFGRILMDPDGQHAWLTDHANGVLYQLETYPLRIVARRSMRRGVRHLVVDAKRDRLYVANQLTGELTVLRRSDLEPIATRQIGRRTGVLSLSEDGDRIVFVSAAGAFSLDLDVL